MCILVQKSWFLKYKTYVLLETASLMTDRTIHLGKVTVYLDVRSMRERLALHRNVGCEPFLHLILPLHSTSRLRALPTLNLTLTFYE